MDKYAAMGRPGSADRGLDPSEPDRLFPLRFHYFEEKDDLSAYVKGIQWSWSAGCAGVYIFACDPLGRPQAQIAVEHDRWGSRVAVRLGDKKR